MLLKVHFYDIERVKDSDYCIFTLDFFLTQREISDIFCTEWLELNVFDYLSYEAVFAEYDYCKLFLKDELVYSGNILTVHELQSKLKHLTRVDFKF